MEAGRQTEGGPAGEIHSPIQKILQPLFERRARQRESNISGKVPHLVVAEREDLTAARHCNAGGVVPKRRRTDRDRRKRTARSVQAYAIEGGQAGVDHHLRVPGRGGRDGRKAGRRIVGGSARANHHNRCSGRRSRRIDGETRVVKRRGRVDDRHSGAARSKRSDIDPRVAVVGKDGVRDEH